MKRLHFCYPKPFPLRNLWVHQQFFSIFSDCSFSLACKAQPIQLLKTQVLRRGELKPYKLHRGAINRRCETFQHTPWTTAAGRQTQPSSDTTCKVQPIQLLKTQVLRRGELKPYKPHRGAMLDIPTHPLDHNSRILSTLKDKPNQALIPLVRPNLFNSLKPKC